MSDRKGYACGGRAIGKPLSVVKRRGGLLAGDAERGRAARSAPLRGGQSLNYTRAEKGCVLACKPPRGWWKKRRARVGRAESAPGGAESSR